MEYYIERLERELNKIATFWARNVIAKNTVTLYPACSIDGTPDPNATLGSLYLSRIIYGASAICKFLDTNDYKPLADLAFKILYERFRNPSGGFYWARNTNNEIIHDSDNVNMSQAFILYGLTEYAHLTKNPVVLAEMKKQQQFILRTLKDTKDGGYLDGFNVDWKQEKNFTKSLGTHLHLMEAFVKQYEYTNDNSLKLLIEELIEIICNRFFDSNTFECYHTCTPGWNKLPNFNWAGHNAEVSWLITYAANVVQNEKLQKNAAQISGELVSKVLQLAFDKNYGGVFNEIIGEQPVETNKLWWPQAETAIACMNYYVLSKDKNYLSYGLRLLEYIENTFSDSVNGEWYTMVTKEGMPIESEPKVHLWKSMYHNVRYCLEMSRRIKELIR